MRGSSLGLYICVVCGEVHIDWLDFPRVVCRVVAGLSGQCDNLSAASVVVDLASATGRAGEAQIDLLLHTP